MRGSALLAGAAALLAGCTVGPDYRPPAAAAPAGFAEPVPAGARQGTVDLAHWWQAFGDAELDRLEQQALAQGLDIAEAASRVRQARYAAAIARARYLPSIDARGGVNRIDFSKNAGFSSLAALFGNGSGGVPSGGGAAPGVAGPGGGITTFSGGFDASWELDLFGGGRRSAEAARARLEAARFSARDAAVTLAAEVAQNYLALRTDQARAGVLRQEIARQRRLAGLRASRARVGLVPAIDPVRDRAGVEAAEAQLAPLDLDARLRMHALALLTGQAPAALTGLLAAPAAAMPLPPPVPPGLPSELLERRADVRAAERRLAAATADIGVATADLYPRFSLTGLAELISTSLANLLTPGSLQTQASAAAVFPILDFGRRHTTVELRREDAEQAYVAYRRTVLTALKDVEDALARVDAAQKQVASLSAARADAERSAAALDARYRTGLTDLTPVLQADALVIQQQQSLAEAQGSLGQALASLFKALGGGWDQAAVAAALKERQRATGYAVKRGSGG